MIEPIDNYYFKDGAYYLKSKWSKRIRVLLSTMIVAVSLTLVEDTAHSFNVFRTSTEWKHTYASFIKESNPKVSKTEARDIVLSTLKWANEFSIDEKLLLAIAKVESNFHVHAISTSGAYGLMQVIPVWHKDKILEARKVLGNPEIFNINTNIWLGAKVLRKCLDDQSNINKALLCYAGQTPGYDKKVLSELDNIKKL
jgi:soluble lytic murein transglycosylase-like protein